MQTLERRCAVVLSEGKKATGQMFSHGVNFFVFLSISLNQDLTTGNDS